jgi:uncharacterized protein with ParB-like and HNH nuclease domain
MMTEDTSWFDDYADDESEVQIDEYDITAIPNDFNLITLFNFVESGAIQIPGFQRNYVWDRPRASKLIESFILGIPVPQIFLYEQSKNSFLVIDGQQRLMSIYYFMKRRFPRRDKRAAIRSIFDLNGSIPDSTLHDDEYFEDFKLSLKSAHPTVKNKFHGLNHSRLGEYKTQFDLRPMRAIIVKQNVPAEDNSSMYEVFNRLNTGGINLTAQEIRASMYHSNFYDMLQRLNSDARWRLILQAPEPDIHAKDIEIMLRSLAMLADGTSYRPSMVRFLNAFSKKCQSIPSNDVHYLQSLLSSFFDACSELNADAFINNRNNRLNIALLEAVFYGTCREAFSEKRLLDGKIDNREVQSLEMDADFVSSAVEGSTHTTSVESRLSRARTLISSL